jgi:hypothetical protein
VRNKLFSLARIASKESQRATKVTSGDSDLRDAKATEYSGSLAPCRGERGVAKRGQAWRPPEFRATKKGVLFFPKRAPQQPVLAQQREATNQIL